MQVLQYASLRFVDPAYDALFFLLGLVIFNPGVLCILDVPTLRFASLHFVDPAPVAVLFLLRHLIFGPDTLFPSDVLVRRLASLLFVDSASVRLAGRLDVRYASMHFVDPAFR